MPRIRPLLPTSISDPTISLDRDSNDTPVREPEILTVRSPRSKHRSTLMELLEEYGDVFAVCPVAVDACEGGSPDDLGT